MAASCIQLAALSSLGLDQLSPFLGLDALQCGVGLGGRLLDHHHIVCQLQSVLMLRDRADNLLVCFFEGQGLPAEKTLLHDVVTHRSAFDRGPRTILLFNTRAHLEKQLTHLLM